MTSNLSNGRQFRQRISSVTRTSLSRLLDPLTLAVWVVMSCLAALSGPFGTYGSIGFLELAWTWLVLLAALITLAYVSYEVCREFLPFLDMRKRQWVFAAVGTVILSIALDLLLTHWLARPIEQRPSLMMLFLYVGAIMLSILMIRRMIPYLDQYDLTENKDVTPEAGVVIEPEALRLQNRLAARLDLPMGANILSVSASGHFVDVSTCQQTKRIRMRFSDAVLELDGTAGIITHRSHWVKLEAVRGWVPHATRPYVVLANGAQIPVSKTYFSKVEEANFDILDVAEFENS